VHPIGFLACLAISVAPPFVNAGSLFKREEHFRANVKAKSMSPSVAVFLALFPLGGAFVAAAWALVYRLTPEHRRRQILHWLGAWSLKGLVVPLALWALMNIGLSFELQPFIPRIQLVRNAGGHWYFTYLRYVGYGIFIITSYWSALTLAWALYRVGAGTEGEGRANFKALCWTCFLGMLIPAAIIQLLGGWVTLGLASLAILAPLAGAAPSVLNIKKMPPMYARAVARIKFGKYAEAEWEIIRELEKSENDFEGWLMLAELYANHFRDLREAEQTILEICDQPKVTPSQLAVALHRLADWHLKLASDPDAARRALQIICDRLPGSHLARMAQLRSSQLPATADELRDQQSVKPIPLPALHDPLDDARAPLPPQIPEQEALEQAKNCVAQLTRNPNNVPAREKLARLFADHLHQPDRGLEQVGLLLGLPEQPDAKRAEWLALSAMWQLRYRQDTASGRALLEQLLREFPNSPQSFAARRRLQSLDQPEYTG
jgi:hypothetical protein